MQPEKFSSFHTLTAYFAAISRSRLYAYSESNSPNSYMLLNDGSFAWKELDGKIYHEYRV